MKSIRAVCAALIAWSLGAGTAGAMPQTPAAQSSDLVTKVIVDCHPDTRLHYLPKYDRKVLHRHRQSDCRVILVNPPQEAVDCHSDTRLHYLPKYDRKVWHRHRQSDCRVVIVDPPGEAIDCHRDVRKHYLPEYGRSLYHRHVGESCRIRIFDEYEGGEGGGNCVKIGPVTLCESRNY